MPRRPGLRGRGDQLGGLALKPLGAAVGIAGTLIFGAAIAITAAAYRGATGEAYSPLNHYVSELGQLGVSGLAGVFNLGLVIGGTLLAIFFLALGLSRRSALAWLYVPVGICAGIGGTFVGLYPMNFPNEHTAAALTFFVLGWIAVGLASIDFLRRRDPRFPWWLAVIGALTVAAFIGYLWVYFAPSADTAGLPRAGFSVVTTLEWGVIAGILIWVFATSLTWRRAERGARS